MEYNLQCSAGHRFYAPDPNYWDGKVCGRKLKNEASCKREQRKIETKKKTGRSK